MVAFLLVAAALAADPRWMVLNRAANDAIAAGDYARLRTALQELEPWMPGNARNAYNSAAALAKLGEVPAALASLNNLAAMGLVYDLDADSDFDALKGNAAYATARARLQSNRAPVTHTSAPPVSLAERDLLPEDLVYDAARKLFFISSVREAKIVTSEGKDFAHADWSVLALALDAKRRILWASTAWTPHCLQCRPEDRDKTALVAFHADTGALLRRVPSPVPGLLGDMTISRGGVLYVSEGIHGAVFRLPVGGTSLERLDEAGEFPSPQTPALSADEKILYIADYVRGIAEMTLAPRAVRWLRPGPGIALSGIDGLYVVKDGWIAVQNGTRPPRIVHFSRDLRSQEILEANTPWLGEPTHGARVRNKFFFLANTGWSQYDAEGKKKAGTAPVESTIRAIEFRPR